MLEDDNHDLVVRAMLESMARAGDKGIERMIIGASPGALYALRKGALMKKPFIDFNVTITMTDGTKQYRKVPVFCDPGLDGLKVYAIAWPLIEPNNDIKIKVS